MRSHVELSPREERWREQHLATLGHAAVHPAAAKLGATPSNFGVHGKDISSYQPVGNFAEGGRSFAIFKASEATTYADPHFAGNRKAARDEHMIASGLYDFARPSRNGAADEFHKFISVVGEPGPSEFAVLDYETPPWNQAWACQWADLAYSVGFKRVVFYSYLGMLTANATDQIAAKFTDLWVAAYGCSIPHGDRWKTGPYGWTFHQHTDGQASVGCNDGGTDCSAFYGSAAELATWIGHSQPPAPPTKAKEAEMLQSVEIPPDNKLHVIGLPNPGNSALFSAGWLSFCSDFEGGTIRYAIFNENTKNWRTVIDAAVVHNDGRIPLELTLQAGDSVLSVKNKGPQPVTAVIEGLAK